MTEPRTTLILLGVLALLSSTGLLVTAITIGGIGLVVLSLCGLLLVPLRRLLLGPALLFAALLVGGVLISLAALLLQVHSAELHAYLAPSLPLLLLPCLGLALDSRVEARSGLAIGLWFAAVALLLGLLREGLGNATLLTHGDWLLGQGAAGWQLSLANLNGAHLLTLAPGAFILLGLLLAALRHFHHDGCP